MAFSRVGQSALTTTTTQSTTTNLPAYAVQGAGNTLLLVATTFDGHGDLGGETVADDRGNIWVRDVELHNGGGTGQAFTWRAEGCPAGATTVTITTPYAAFVSAIVLERAGLATSALDQTGATPVDEGVDGDGLHVYSVSTDGTTAQADEYAVAVASPYNGANSAITEDAPWSLVDENEDDAFEAISVIDLVLSSTGTPTARWRDADATGVATAPRVIATYQIASGGGSTYTLDADAGSVGLTGSAATTRAGRRVSATSGSVAFTGTAATVRVDHRLPATSGSVSETGTAATLRAVRRLVAGAVSYAVTGTTAALRRGLRIGASSTSVTVTGQPATLRYSGAASTYTLTADPTSVTLADSPATLRRTYVLSAGSASLALTGTSAALRAARRLAASVVAFTLTGTAAIVRAARRLAGGTTSIALTGSPAATRVDRRVVAQPAGYAVTFADATLRTTSQDDGVEVIELVGTYSPVIELVGTYSPVIELVGTYSPVVKLVGTWEH